MKEISSFRDLKVWQLSMQISKRIFMLTKSFPKEQIYVLASHIQKTSISIPSNIAEGYCRDTTADYLRFLSIALGSAGELETQLILAKELDFIKDQDFITIEADIIYLRKMLKKLSLTLKTKLLNPKS